MPVRPAGCRFAQRDAGSPIEIPAPNGAPAPTGQQLAQPSVIPTQPRPPMTPSGSPSTQHPPTLSARRHFVDWSDPALPGAARILLERGADGEKTGEGRADRQVGGGGDGPTAGAGDRERVGGAHGPTAATTTGVLDLSELLVILPGGRAGRRLLELLLDGAEARGRALRPPRIATLGALPEILFPPVRPEPGPLVERRVWAEALRDLPPQGLELLLSRPPARGALSRWMGLGRLVRDLQRTVGAEGHTFADVARACQEGLLFNDEERWALLARAQRHGPSARSGRYGVGRGSKTRRPAGNGSWRGRRRLPGREAFPVSSGSWGWRRCPGSCAGCSPVLWGRDG